MTKARSECLLWPGVFFCKKYNKLYFSESGAVYTTFYAC